MGRGSETQLQVGQNLNYLIYSALRVNIVLMLVHHLRRWPDIKTTLDERLCVLEKWYQIALLKERGGVFEVDKLFMSLPIMQNLIFFTLCFKQQA